MFNLNKILLPVDGSDHSMRASQFVLDLASLSHGEVLLIHCHRPFPAILGEPYFQKAVSKIMDKSNQLLEPFRELLKNGNIPYSDRILEGSPGEVIPRTAEIESCGIIVMGSRGRSNLEGLLLGSVTHRVLSAASCPVLVI